MITKEKINEYQKKMIVPDFKDAIKVAESIKDNEELFMNALITANALLSDSLKNKKIDVDMLTSAILTGITSLVIQKKIMIIK